MKNKLRNGIALTLIPQIILVKWLAGHPDWVENYYSNGLYPWISKFFRNLFGWIPFSIGEVIYTLLIFLVFRYILRNRRKIKTKPLLFLRDNLMVLAVFYFTFHVVWGLNYYRQPLAETLSIKKEASYAEIKNLTERLILKTNELQKQITGDSTSMVKVPYTRNEIFEKTISNYNGLDSQMSFLEYRQPSIKKSMFSHMSSYMGIGGYLNPFTNEAQVNKRTPVFRFPVVAAHEIGHQVGYSAENETNLIGYLVTQKNEDIYFQYSASAYALAYCLNAVNGTDEKEFEKLYANINEGVKKNYRELQDFHEAYENPFEPIFKSVFNTFLKANNQADGVQSYSRVVHLLVGYHEKHPIN
ncbi:DUF3810 domain-containing protein [Maribacter sp. 2308TA10-17]|uniref:DUF3810 domain-containing protein n=1 Tax=Maribacter sp. 2308TA10-17 TaxID=3386276 RepID=UPI0039BD83C2